MKTLFLLIVSTVCISITTSIAQNNVGIGTPTPNAKAILELMANDKGFLAPRVTTTQMLSISSSGVVPNGLLVYNTTTECFNYWKTTTLSWKDMCSGGLGNGKDTIVIVHVDTLISNIIITDSLFAHVINTDSLFAHYIKTDSLFSHIINTDSLFAHYIKTDSIYAHFGSFDSLNVGGKNITQIITDSIAAQAWLLKGNMALATYKLGTLNLQDLHIVANNTEKLTVASSTGYVGVNQTLPSQQLDVAGNLKFDFALMPAGVAGTTGDVLISKGAGLAPQWQNGSTLSTTLNGVAWTLLGNNGTNASTNFLGTTDAIDVVFKTNAIERARITTTGNVGIGTSIPNEQLHIMGPVTGGVPAVEIHDPNTTANAGFPRLLLRDEEYAIDKKCWDMRVNQGGLMFGDINDAQTIFNNRLYIAPTTGNVGIGTATPIDKLHLKGFDGRDIVFSPGSLTPTLNFMHNDNGNVNARWAYVSGVLSNGGTGFNYGHLTFGTAPGVAGNPATIERMRIDGEGNVSINSSTYFIGDVFSVRANNYGSTTSNTVGFYAINGYSSAGVAIYGSDNSTGKGVEGRSVSGVGVEGVSTGEDGVYGQSGASLSGGVTGLNTNVGGSGVLGRGDWSAGDTWLVPTSGAGGAFNGDDLGVTGYANNSTSGLSAGTTSGGGYFRDSITTVSKTYAWVGAYNSGTKYKIIGDGSVSTIVKDKKEVEHIMYCTESPEVLFDDYGKGQLVNGEAIIHLDETFAHNIIVNDKHDLRVFIQLEGDCNGVYVADKTNEGFKVKELNKGLSNVKFSYHVIGNRKDELVNGQVASKYADNRFPEAKGLHLNSVDISKKINARKHLPTKEGDAPQVK